jgi:hypothetical protein
VAIPRVLLAALLLPPGVLAFYAGLRSREATAVPPAQTSATPPASQPRVATPTLAESGDTLRLTLPRETNGQSITVVQFIENKSDGAAHVECVRIVLRDSLAQGLSSEATFNQRSCAGTPKVALPAWSLTPITVTFAVPSGTPPFVGQLAIATYDSTSRKSYLVARAMRLSYAPTARGSPYAEGIVLYTLLAALLVAVLATLSAADKQLPGATLSWEPGSSWASNVGVAGGLLAALGTAFLPEQPRYLAKPAYALLAAVFVAVTALAPSVYAFVAKLKDNAFWRGAAVALAGAVTLWGALGQMATTWALFGELVHARVLPRIPAKTFQGLMIGLGILLVLYAWVSIRGLFKTPPEEATAAAAATGRSPYKLL